MTKPLLSIGMIFRNELRCLERCLKSLQPLREALPCELVMADTGSDDGSREIAERYADILIDFPWIDDFSAARNAVMDRCSGEWHFFIDSDEWLDEDISGLTSFLRGGGGDAKSGIVVLRNYSHEAEGEFHVFHTTRLGRMSPHMRFQGSIHEGWPKDCRTPSVFLPRVILYHDGYIFETEEQRLQKARRNMALLRRELERDPEDLRLLLLCIMSGAGEPDYVDLLRRAVAAVERRPAGWEKFGPPVLRYAVYSAYKKKLPELEAWAAQAEEWFPDSFYTRIDVEWLLFAQAWENGDFEQCVRRGECYLRAIEDSRAGRGDQTTREYGALMMESPQKERRFRISLAGAYIHTGREERAAELLGQIDGGELDAEQTQHFTLALQELHKRTMYDTAPLVSSFWEQISRPEPGQKRADERMNAVYGTAFNVFTQKLRDEEKGKEEFCRCSYTLYLPLRDTCELGRAAAILDTEDGAEMAKLLLRVERWNALPIQALTRALDRGVTFPLPDRPLNLEEMDGLARRLAEDKESICSLVSRIPAEDFTANGQALFWAQELSTGAVQAFDWKAEDADTDVGLALARFLAQTEKAFLPFCYSPQILREENLPVLPSIHRFGWYCIRAFDALDSGNTINYVRLLRSGLSVCNQVKHMVEFLLERTPELQKRPDPSAELMALAEQIRAVLARFAPDDPAVAALKQSEAYQKVAYLIEGADQGLFET